MMQGIQLSMLMTGADNTLRLDGALPDTEIQADTEQTGLAFGEVLGSIVQPAKNGPALGKLRQIPAGISMLNGVSQALLAAAQSKGEAEPDTDIASEATALLTSSLLGQIALKEKPLQADSEADAASTEQPDLTDGLQRTDIAGEGKIIVIPDIESPVLAETKTAATVDTQVNTQQMNVVSDKAELPATDNAEQVPDSKVPAQRQAELPVMDSAATKSPELQQVKADNAAVTEVVKATAADSSAKTIATTAAVSPAEHISVKEDAGTVVKANVDIKATVADSPEPVISAAIKEPAKADESPKSADNSAPVANKVELKTTAEKTDTHSAAKGGSEQTASQQNSTKQDNGQQQASQQGSRQNNMAQPTPDSPAPVPDNTTTATKAATDTSAAVRSETAFSTVLQAAEQRQASAVKTVTTPLAEQLKQSLNLLQQDAAGQLRERVSLMVRQNIQIAEIRLDPAGLGQMQIKIDMQQDQASVQFIVQQPQAKELLEQQLPRLREMLQQQGIQLAEGQVQQQSQQSERQLAQRDGNGNGRSGAHAGEEAGDDVAEVVQLNVNTSDRLVDYYA